MPTQTTHSDISKRFRGFLPIVVDVETAGFDAQRHALLEVAAVIITMNSEARIEPAETIACHVEPFEGAQFNEASLAFTGIDPYHPFRFAMPEHLALETIFKPVRKAVRESGCSRAILVGHNPFFDLGFIKAAVDRTGIKRNPFHAFSTFDTATLGGLVYGQTVLARIAQVAGMAWDEDQAHSAVYDAERTAELFCTMVNRWDDMIAERAHD